MTSAVKSSASGQARESKEVNVASRDTADGIVDVDIVAAINPVFIAREVKLSDDAGLRVRISETVST